MHRTATTTPPTKARTATLKQAASGMRTWLLDASVAIVAIAIIALATALTSH